MKQKLKHLLKFIMLCAVIAISSCTQEKEYVNSKNHKEIYFKEKTLDELLKQPFFAEPFSKFAKSSKRISSSAESRTALEENFDFTIVPEMIKVAEKEDGSVTYTFLIERIIKDESFFENLIIDVNVASEYDAFMIKYIPENPDNVFANFNQFTGFNGVKETTFLESSKVFYDSFCFTITESICYETGYCAENDTDYQQPHAPGNPGCCPNPVHTAMEICVGGGGASNTNNNNPPNNNNSQTTSSSTSNGGGGGTSNSDPITTPIPCVNCVDFNGSTATPCDKLNKLIETPTSGGTNPFKAALIQNQSDANTLTYETGYAIKMNAQFEATIVPIPNNTAAGSVLTFTEGFTWFGYFHCHPAVNDLKEMFSLEDLVKFYNVVRKHFDGATNYQDGPAVDVNNFVVTVATQYGTYAIKINDLAAFKTKFADITTNYDKFYEFQTDYERKISKNQYNSVGTYVGSANNCEKNMLTAIKDLLGNKISLYKADNDFTSWSKLELVNNEVIPKPCNN